MMAAADLALRTAVVAALRADPALAGLLGGEHVYDEAPPQVQPPYVAMGETQVRDWASADCFGAEHFLTLDIWSRHHGVSECLNIAANCGAVLNDAPLALAGYALVILRQRELTTARRDRGRLALARLTFRALTQAQ